MTIKEIFNYLVGLGFTPEGTAGLMGNLKAESNFNSKNLQNTSEKRLSLSDEEYTEAVDNGSYANFVRDSAGYGLAQWTYWNRKQKLLDFAKAQGASIGDCKMQLDFLYKELQGYKTVFEVLKTASSIKEASDVVLTQYEKPANQSEAVKKKRAQYGQEIYAQCVKEEAKKNMNDRQKIVDIMKAWVGKKESDGSHKEIIDIYNAHKPLARSYKVKYTDSWCATTVSAAAIMAGLTDIIPTECSCQKQIELFKKIGCWVEDENRIPNPGDIIYYDWQDNGSGDNTGWSDHVGIVEKVVGTKITVIEGNYNNAVKRRTLAVNGKYIRGYGVPKYTAKTTVKTPSPASTSSATASSVKVDSAKSFEKAVAKKYTTTAALTLRAGAGTDKDKITVIPKGKTVQCYGYYTAVNGVKWLLVKYGNYTGFCSSKYLK